MNNYDWLISRLDAFIRKYYANKVIRGSLIFLICLLSYVLMVSVGEYYLYMPVWLKVSLVSLFVLAGSTALIAWVAIPLSKMARLGKVISHETAATIVGTHFPEISDKLLNILQLRKQSGGNASVDLIAASIEQKASQISVIPITAAVDLTKNRKYLRFLLPVVLAGVFILVAAPNVFKDATERLLQPTKEFERPAPFQFVIKNPKLQAIRNADFVLEVEVKGDVLPAEMSVVLGSDKVPMQALEGHKFRYVFRNVTEAVDFRLFAAGYNSKEYKIDVAQKPVVKSFKIHLDYPEYTGKKDEERSSLGDMTVPAGTLISWGFVAEHTDEARLRLGDGGTAPILGVSGMYGAQFRFLNDSSYTFILSNKKSNITDSYKYHVQVIPDEYPVLQLQEFRDTVSGKQVLMSGTAGDDYGLTRVLFHYTVTDKDKTIASKSVPLKTTGGSLTTFQHYFDIDQLHLLQGQKVSYYVEAWDNDGVHGAKASRSEVMSYQAFSDKQLDSAINENAKQINSGLSNSAQETRKMQEELKEMQSKLLQSDKIDWENQQSLMEMSEKQESLKEQLENIKKRFEEQMQQSKQKQMSEAIQEQQEEIKEQMENLLNNELKEMMKKLQELMQKLNKDQAMQTMQQMQEENKLFEMDMKRLEALMKQLETRMQMEEMANKLDKMVDKQLDLKAQTDQQKKPNDALAKQQEDLKKQLDKLMKEDMKQLKETNDQQGKEKHSLNNEEKAGEDAQQEMQKSEEELNSGENSKSSKSQNQAAKNLQDMANSLRSKAAGMDMEQLDIDIKMTRQILTNLMRLSFDQEGLMKKIPQTNMASQSYIGNQHEQQRLHNNSKMIRDSLQVLAMRVEKLDATINRETAQLERSMKGALRGLEERRVQDATTKQQYAMTSVNNLALMLNEVLSNLMAMQAQGQPGEGGMCTKPGKNPGGKKPKPGAGQQLSDIITQQQSLGSAMQQMQSKQGQKPNGKEGKEGKEGQQPKDGGQKQGGNQGGGEYGDAEQLARMAEQQAAIRRQLQELNSLLNSKGMGNAKELKEIQEKMDKTETDLVNKRMTSELLLRQKEILTRLLEAEKSLREQEQDDKRSSKSAAEISRPVPAELQKRMTEQQRLMEFYKTVPPQLKPYYRTMVEQYYQSIGNK